MEKLLSYIQIDELVTEAATFLPRFVAAVLVLLAFWLVYKVTSKGISKIMRRAGLDEAITHFVVHNFYRIIVLVFGIVMAAGQLGINVGAAVAGLGVAGIAIGFAAQDALANTISGIVIFWDRPFTVGDYVDVQGQYGRVTQITLRSTRIRTPQNTYVVIPNKHIVDAVLVNHSHHGETRVDVPVGIAYKENIEEARRVLLAAMEGAPGVATQPAPDVVAVELGNSSVNLLVRVWIENAADERGVWAQTIERSKVALDAAGIQIPFPHLQLFVDNVENRVWERIEKIGGVTG